MTRLEWGTDGEKYYEAGVDRGVLYPQTGAGVPWNGLVSVTEKPTGGSSKPYYNDGKVYLNDAGKETFSASIEAFMYPEEFEVSDGTYTSEFGLSVDQQPRLPFSLSYRTLIGNDIQGLEKAYKIHFIYNALAAPTTTTRKTLTASPDAGTFSWDISTTPIDVPGFGVSAHLSVDTRKVRPNVIQRIEERLYGSATEAPRMLTPLELIDLLDNEQFQLQLFPNATTGFAKIGDGYFSDVEYSKIPGFFIPTPSTRLRPTSVAGVSLLQES